MFEDKGSPGLKLAGNVGGLGDKFIATRNGWSAMVMDQARVEMVHQ